MKEKEESEKAGLKLSIQKTKIMASDPFAAAAAATSLQSCPTLCDPIDGSPPGSPVPGILQVRTLDCHFLLQYMESEVTQSFMANRQGNSGNSERLYFGGLQNHCR